MKFTELLFEKGLTVGEKELRQAIARSDEFTYGFEAEFVHREVDASGLNISVDVDEINSVDDIMSIYARVGADDRETHRTLMVYLDRIARRRATEQADAKGIDRDDRTRWQKVYGPYYMREYEKVTKDWDLTAEEKTQLIKAPSAGIFHVYVEDDTIDLEPRDSEHFVVQRSLQEYLNEKVRVTSPAGKTDYAHWNITSDSSIAAEPGTFGIEVISPVYDSYERFMSAIDNIFAYIYRYGDTNDSTGFHVNIGLKNSDMGVDLLKLQLLMGDDYIARMFGREANQHAEQIKDWAKQKLTVNKFDPEAKSDPNALRQYIESELLEPQKYKTVNISKYYEGNYIEFRAAGGENYHKQPQKVEYAIKRYLYGLVVSTDPDVGRKEYLSKLARLIIPAREEMTQDEKIKAKMEQAGISHYEADSYVKSIREALDQPSTVARRLAIWLIRAKGRYGAIPKAVRPIIIRDIQRSALVNYATAWDQFVAEIYERSMDNWGEFEELVRELSLQKLEPKGAKFLSDIADARSK
jgi:hypothetical protein